MPNLSNYTGRELNAFANGVIHALEAEGFEVASTPERRYGQSKALRITWRGVYIGLMRENLWGGNPRLACLYRFPDTDRLSIAKAPDGFDKDVFARQHDCDVAMLHMGLHDGESYLYVRDEVTTLELMRDWARRIDKIFFELGDGVEEERLQRDLDSILQDKSKSLTERLAEVAIRLGQGKFRADLEQEFRSACAVTGLTVSPVLRASHIVPWRDSNDEERRDPNNGLLLSANMDALFDRYLITFRPDGEVVCSAFLNGHDQRGLGPIGDLLKPPSPSRAGYLRRHNAEFDRLERKRSEYASASR